jgi:hypothetical protein
MDKEIIGFDQWEGEEMSPAEIELDRRKRQVEQD